MNPTVDHAQASGNGNDDEDAGLSSQLGAYGSTPSSDDESVASSSDSDFTAEASDDEEDTIFRGLNKADALDAALDVCDSVIEESMKNIKREMDDKKEVDPFRNNVYYPVSYWTDDGGRKYQEDRFDIASRPESMADSNSSIYAVYDGHNGARASAYCKQYLIRDLATDPSFNRNPRSALSRAILGIGCDFNTKAAENGWTDGTTAIVAVVHNKCLYVANVGDSRCILIQTGGRVVPMSDDHKPNREDEERRVRGLGGRVLFCGGSWRVEGLLAMSRSIGDVHLHPYVICEPEIQMKQLMPDDEFLVIASDGLWDVVSNDDVGKIVWAELQSRRALTAFANIARQLCGKAVKLRCRDNVTVLVVDLRGKG